MEYISQHVVIERLRELMKDHKQGRWARKAGVSSAYVSMVIRGTKPPGPKILKALGLKRVVFYTEATNGDRSRAA